MDIAAMKKHQEEMLGVAGPTPPDDYEQPMQDQQMQQLPEGSDPFAMQKYQDVNVPDEPVQYGGSMAADLLNDSEVPESIRKKYWPVFHKDNTLTFLDENRKMSKLLNFDIMKIDMLNATPYYEFNFEKELEFNILRNVFETKLDRALGFGKGGNVKNERIMLQSQFSENRNINENENNTLEKQSFFKRLLGRR